MLCIIANAVAVLLLPSCDKIELKSVMDSAENLMWVSPDSALNTLALIDTSKLSSKSLIARYSLLHTMALDKNGIKTIDSREILPAARYYEYHGSDEDRMRMYYYLGLLQSRNGDLKSATDSYISARDFAVNLDNMLARGMICSAISDLYTKNGNVSESIVWAKEACNCFSQSGDSLKLWMSTGQLANCYLNICDWSKADSTYSIFFSYPVRDSVVYAKQLLSLASANIYRPIANPSKSIDLFWTAVRDYKAMPSIEDYCVFAYASEINGDTATADNMIDRLIRINKDTTLLKIYRAGIFEHRGDYKQALDLCKQYIDELYLDASLSSAQIAVSQSDYYEKKSEFLDMERTIRGLIIMVLALLAIILVFSALWIYLNHKRRWQLQFEEMSAVNESVNRKLYELSLRETEQLHSIKSLTMENKQWKEKIFNLTERLATAECDAISVEKHIKEKRNMYFRLKDLCYQYFVSQQSSKRGKEYIYAEVKSFFKILDEANQDMLEQRLDEDMNGIMSKLRTLMPDLTNGDFRFISLCILTLDAKTIARITGYTVSTVYNKRYNLKDKISRLDSVDKEFFLGLIFE